MSNPVLGTVACSGCGGQATIKQTKRRGNYLYSQCIECGIDQRTGKQVQNTLWHGAEWKSGIDKMQHRPANVTEEWLAAKEDKQALVNDWVPEEEEEEGHEPVSVPVKSGSSRALLVVGFLVVGVTTILRVIK